MKHVCFLYDGWQFRQKGKRRWWPATVPGVVHLDLLDNGLIPDPFYADHEARLQWIEEEDWEYRTTFRPGDFWYEQENVELVFKGLDTYASVRLNGRSILKADNMFREWRVPVKQLLEKGENELRVLFRSPIREARSLQAKYPFPLPAANDRNPGTSPFTRKAPYHFGWDWGPRLVTSGIWQPVFLEAWNLARIRHVQLIPEEIQPEKARLRFRISVEASTVLTIGLRIALQEDRTRVAEARCKVAPGYTEVDLLVEIPSPKRWYPRGFGEQFLYKFVIRLFAEERLVDEQVLRTGLRTVQLLQEQDAWGESFTLAVNGIPLFAKGANWIPCDSFLPRISETRYRHLLESAARANMNMLRVWGGGIYENDVFYDLCDELGILVWQDFMFACALYPADDAAFLQNVEAEIRYQIRRLRHHPSIVLWCGNNEIEQEWFEGGWSRQFPGAVWEANKRLFYQVLPELCRQEDPQRPYWPGSPSSRLEDTPNSQRLGDVHYWGVWHFEKPFETYLQQFPRFMSEFGFQSFPEPRTVASYAPPEQWDIESPVMMAHQKHPRGNQLIRQYMERYFPEPVDFPAFLYVSQILQAEAIRMAAEHLRRARPRCMGSLYWQLDDCWPVASWSSIDYYGRWKALHYYSCRFYAPVLISPVLTKDRVEVYVVSDLLEAVEAIAGLQFWDLTGEVLHEENFPVEIPPQSCRKIWEGPLEAFLSGRKKNQSYFVAKLRRGGTVLSSNLLFFSPIRAYRLPVPHLGLSARPVSDGAEVDVWSDRLAIGVWLISERTEGQFSDNFFFLLPGERKKVTFRPFYGMNWESFQEGLRVESLAAAFRW